MMGFVFIWVLVIVDNIE